MKRVLSVRDLPAVVERVDDKPAVVAWSSRSRFLRSSPVSVTKRCMDSRKWLGGGGLLFFLIITHLGATGPASFAPGCLLEESQKSLPTFFAHPPLPLSHGERRRQGAAAGVYTSYWSCLFLGLREPVLAFPFCVCVCVKDASQYEMRLFPSPHYVCLFVCALV